MCFPDKNIISEVPNSPSNTEEREQTENIEFLDESENSTAPTMNCVVCSKETSGKNYAIYSINYASNYK